MNVIMKGFWLPEFDVLAQYNAERSRGVQHTSEWQERMSELQVCYDKRLRDHCEKAGMVVV